MYGILFHVQALMKEVQEHKSVVDTLNDVSGALLELVPWRAREGLDKLIAEDNERYRLASDAISQHVDQTGAAILKSQQVRLLIACWLCCDDRSVLIRCLTGLDNLLFL